LRHFNLLLSEQAHTIKTIDFRNLAHCASGTADAHHRADCKNQICRMLERRLRDSHTNSELRSKLGNLPKAGIAEMDTIFSRILCPIDFERDSMDALELACRIAKQNSAKVYLLTVIGEPLAGAATELPPPVVVLPNAQFELECRLRLKALAEKKLAGVSYEIIVVSGNAAPQILWLATVEHIDLIVMGTHARTGIKRFLLGSVAERIVRESPVPVLTIHPKAAE
jgi:nucleotide-binding universal stress UspA family protein